MSYGKKTKSPGWQSGNHWVKCDVCPFVYRNSDMRKRWDGAVVCKWDYEPRHPQDLTRGVKDDTSPKGFVRPEGTDTFVSVVYCTSHSSIPAHMIPGCAVPGDITTPNFTDDDVPAGTF